MYLRKQKKYFLVFIVILCIISMVGFSSCRLLNLEEEGVPVVEQPEPEPEEGLPAPADREPRVRISLWDCLEAKERLALMDSVDEFTNINPEVDIEVRHIRSEEELLDQFEAASLAGSGPDLAIVDLVSVNRMAESNVIAEINDIDYGRFLDGLAEISEYEEKNYMVPLRATDFLAFYYNRAFIETAPRDFESIVEHCLEVVDFQEPVFGFVLNNSQPDWIIPFIGGYSTWIIDYNNYSISLDTSAMEKTLEFLYMLYDPDEPVTAGGMGYEDMHAMFKSGNIHMIINSFKVREQYQGEGMNLGISAIPEVYGEGKNPTPLISGKGIMINANSFGEELETANKLIEFLLSVEQQVKWTQNTDTFPAVIAVEESSYFQNNELLSNMLEQAKLCRGIPPDNEIRVVRDSISLNVPRAIEDRLAVEEVVRKIEEDAIRLRAGSITVEDLREESIQQGGE